MHRPLITVGRPIEYTARELSTQLWYTIEANQIYTQQGTLWDGRWDFNLSLRLAEPWRWISDHLAEKVEINPKFAQQNFREQLLRRGLNPDQFEFPKGKGHNQVIKYVEPERPKKTTAAATPVKRPGTKLKPVVIETEPPKPKKKTLLFVNGQKVEVEDAEILDDVARKRRCAQSNFATRQEGLVKGGLVDCFGFGRLVQRGRNSGRYGSVQNSRNNLENSRTQVDFTKRCGRFHQIQIACDGR
jgi:hypothetical protein